jgi:hypothetical protein
MGDRHAHRHLTVLLLAEHPAVLARDADGVAPFLRDSGVVDDPRRHRAMALQGREHRLPGHAQHGPVVPAGVRNEVMHRLMAGPDMARIDPRGHRLDALPLPRQTQPGNVVPQRTMPILVTQGGGETLNVCTEPLGAGARVIGHTPRLPAYPMPALTFLTQ